MKLLFMLAILISFHTQIISAQDREQKSLKYLGQTPPGLIPKIFAPETVSKKNEYEFGSVFSSNGEEFYYAVTIDGKAEIRCMKLEGDQWTMPEKIVYSDQYGYNDPFLSPDENKLFLFLTDL